MYDKIVIKSVDWFNTKGGTIGIVVINNGFQNKAYIKVVNGEDEQYDIQDIIDWGSTLPLNTLKYIIDKL